MHYLLVVGQFLRKWRDEGEFSAFSTGLTNVLKSVQSRWIDTDFKQTTSDARSMQQYSSASAERECTGPPGCLAPSEGAYELNNQSPVRNRSPDPQTVLLLRGLGHLVKGWW